LTDLGFTAAFGGGDQGDVIVQVESVELGGIWYAVEQINLPVGSAFQTVPLSSHWATGIAFPPDDEVRFRVDTIVNNRTWFVTYSGYFVEVPPGAMGEESPGVKPSQLGQNMPNPFNPTTKITYTLASAGDIKLRFFDSQGRMVRSLIDGRKEAGEHTVTWDGRSDSGQPLPSGVYYYELDGNAQREARKAILLK
jgi:hypothetical protein